MIKQWNYLESCLLVGVHSCLILYSYFSSKLPFTPETTFFHHLLGSSRSWDCQGCLCPMLGHNISSDIFHLKVKSSNWFPFGSWRSSPSEPGKHSAVLTYRLKNLATKDSCHLYLYRRSTYRLGCRNNKCPFLYPSLRFESLQQIVIVCFWPLTFTEIRPIEVALGMCWML